MNDNLGWFNVTFCIKFFQLFYINKYDEAYFYFILSTGDYVSLSVGVATKSFASHHGHLQGRRSDKRKSRDFQVKKNLLHFYHFVC